MNAEPQTLSISQEYDLPYPPAKVWRALTEPDLLGKWLMANDMRPAVGHCFTFKSEPMPWWDGIVQCEVLEIDLHKRLRYTWRGGPLDTVITWTLTPTQSGGTRLALEHSGFKTADGPAIDGASQGWQRMVGEGLREVLANLA